jgi:predicted metalloprotease
MRRLLPACYALLLVLGCGGGDSLSGPPASEDQDSDGVLDVDDRCPSQAETTNEWKDEDGCPDTTEELYQSARTDIEEYWQRTFRTNNESYAPIRIFQGYETEISTACGASVPQNAFYCRADHGIYYHVSFLDEFLDVGAYAPHFIVAHEFGHSVQNQLGFTRELYTTVLRELQADCFGGAYTRDARNRGILDQRAIESAVLTLFRVGDPLATWFDPAGHGSAGQRIDAFTVGVEKGPLTCASLLSAPPPPPAPGAASTTTTITTDSPDPSGIGQSVAVSIRVTSAGGTPTGSVTVNVLGGSELCSADLSTGLATCSLVMTSQGTRTLIASYVGNSSFAPSSDAEEHIVQPLPSSVQKVSGDNQSGPSSSELPELLVVRLLDSQNNPVAGRTVSWVVGVGGGSVSPENIPTDAEGEASTQWMLGPAVGPNSVNAVVSGVGTVTFNATATAGSPSAGNSEVSAAPTTITVGGQSTITVVARDASNDPVSGASVSVASSGSGNSITPATSTTAANGVATFTFSSTVAEAKTITATASGVAISDQATITVQKTSSIVEITTDEPDPSTANEEVTVEFTVRGSGGTPTGEVVVTISGGTEECRGTLTAGAGSCVLKPLAAGPSNNNNLRTITATYGGDPQSSGDTDTENHRVNPAPQPNQPPTAAFNPPTCTVGVACPFDDGSTDSDGHISSRFWTFQDAVPSTSGEQNPTVIFLSEGSKTVTLEVTDNEGATDTETQQVTVTVPTPVNLPPTAGNDAYTTPGAGQGLSVPTPGVLSNDTDPDGPQPLVARNASAPSQGSVSLNSDGSFTYTPTLGATGTDSFTYEAYDGALATTATVTISITP